MPSDGLGYRENVAMVIADASGRVLWCERVDRDGWQFPQGGIDANERPVQAMERELYEEVGLRASDVRPIATTSGWMYYSLPKPRSWHRKISQQKQQWFLLELLSDESQIALNAPGAGREFRDYRWVNYWYPLRDIVFFKREVYRKGLLRLAAQHQQLVAERRSNQAGGEI